MQKSLFLYSDKEIGNKERFIALYNFPNAFDLDKYIIG